MHDYDERRAPPSQSALMDRRAFDKLVDNFIQDELPSPEAASIAYAAEAFDRRADALPEAQQLLVRRFAAALRERVARLRCH